MFVESKYKKWYYNIIKHAESQSRQKGLGAYFEMHHIVPSSLGGDNSKDNKILLTAREHFICHWLLTKMVDSKKDKWRMMNAIGCMMWMANKKQQRYKISSHVYEQLKTKHSILKSINQTGRKGTPHTEESKRKISIATQGRIPWNKGTRGICIGNPGLIHSAESKLKISNARSNQVITHSSETKIKIGVANSKPIQTPLGLFRSIKDALIAHGKKINRRDWIITQCKKFPSEFYYVERP